MLKYLSKSIKIILFFSFICCFHLQSNSQKLKTINNYISALQTSGMLNNKGKAYLVEEMEVYTTKLKVYKRYLRYFKIKQEEILTLRLFDLLYWMFTHESIRRCVLRLNYEREIRATDVNIDSINLPPDGKYYKVVPFPTEGYKNDPELINNERSVDGLHITKTIKNLLAIGMITPKERETALTQLNLNKLHSGALLFELIVENRINEIPDKDVKRIIRSMVMHIDSVPLSSK